MTEPELTDEQAVEIVRRIAEVAKIVNVPVEHFTSAPIGSAK